MWCSRSCPAHRAGRGCLLVAFACSPPVSCGARCPPLNISSLVVARRPPLVPRAAWDVHSSPPPPAGKGGPRLRPSKKEDAPCRPQRGKPRRAPSNRPGDEARRRPGRPLSPLAGGGAIPTATAATTATGTITPTTATTVTRHHGRTHHCHPSPPTPPSLNGRPTPPPPAPP